MAAKENPTNAPLQELALGDGVLDPQRLTLYTSRYWGPLPKTLTVSFMETHRRRTCGRASSAI